MIKPPRGPAAGDAARRMCMARFGEFWTAAEMHGVLEEMNPSITRMFSEGGGSPDPGDMAEMLYDSVGPGFLRNVGDSPEKRRRFLHLMLEAAARRGMIREADIVGAARKAVAAGKRDGIRTLEDVASIRATDWWCKSLALELGLPPSAARKERAERKPGTETVEPRPPLNPLYDYQYTAGLYIRKMLEGEAPEGEGAAVKRKLFAVPTGSGKTRMVAEALIGWINDGRPSGNAQQRNSKFVLWIAQSGELCEQALSTFREVFEHAGRRGTALRLHRFWGAGASLPTLDMPDLLDGRAVIVATIQSLRKVLAADPRQLEALSGLVSCIVVDEAHHSTADSYTDVLRTMGFNWERRKREISERGIVLVGLTATPFRGTGGGEETERLKRRFNGVYFPDIRHAGEGDNYRPHALIDCPGRAAAGEAVRALGEKSYDRDGFIPDEGYSWRVYPEGAGPGGPAEAEYVGEKNITHRFSRPGGYRIALTVTDNEGGTDTAAAHVQVTEASEEPRRSDEEMQKHLYRKLIKRRILCDVYHAVLPSGRISLDAEETEYVEKFGEFRRDTLRSIGNNEERNRTILSAVKAARKAGRKKVLFFGCSLEHSRLVAAILRTGGVRARSVDSKMDPESRAAAIELFRAGDLEVLCNYDILTAGFDAPNVDCVFVGRPVRSTLMYTQMIGRGMRGTKNGGTEDMLIVDVDDNFQLHDGGDGPVELGWKIFREYWGRWEGPELAPGARGAGEAAREGPAGGAPEPPRGAGGALGPAEPRAHFAAQVREELAGRGHEVDVLDGGLGEGIDLAVVDPEDSGRYALAIRCDGEAYGGLQWKEEGGPEKARIHSTDWWRSKRRRAWLAGPGPVETVRGADWWIDKAREADRITGLALLARRGVWKREAAGLRSGPEGGAADPGGGAGGRSGAAGSARAAPEAPPGGAPGAGEIRERLAGMGYEADPMRGALGPGVGLAVVHPYDPGRYALALECPRGEGEAADPEAAKRRTIAWLEGPGPVMRVSGADWRGGAEGALRDIEERIRAIAGGGWGIGGGAADGPEPRDARPAGAAAGYTVAQVRAELARRGLESDALEGETADLAVVDPRDPRRYVLGVECEGAGLGDPGRREGAGGPEEERRRSWARSGCEVVRIRAASWEDGGAAAVDEIESKARAAAGGPEAGIDAPPDHGPAAGHAKDGEALAAEGLRAGGGSPPDSDLAAGHAKDGEALAAEGRHAEALACFGLSAEADPGCAAALAGRALSLYKMGRRKEAEECCERAAAALPSSPEVHAAWGLVLAGGGNPEGALRCYEKARELSPGSAEYRSRMGDSLSALGRHGEALRCYTRAAELDPKAPGHRASMGDALSALGRGEEARGCYEAAALLEPGGPAAGPAEQMAGAAPQGHGEGGRGQEDGAVPGRAPGSGWRLHTVEEAKNMRGGINVEGTVKSIGEPFPVSQRGGGTARACYAKLEDGTGTISLFLWEDDIGKVSEGARVRIVNGYTHRTAGGAVSIGKGKRGSLEAL